MRKALIQLSMASLLSLLSFFVLAAPAQSQFQALPEARPTSGYPLERAPTCGTPEVDPTTATAVRKILQETSTKVFVDGEVKIPVAVHLITSGKQGKFSRAVVDTLIHNLNVAFDGTGFSFFLTRLDYTNNRKWYESCGPQTANEAAMKKKLAYLPAQVLNLYSCKPTGRGLPAGIIGFAYFPWMFPENSFMQGVVVHPGTLPSGAGIPNYDFYGLNAIHETGHWLGLYHTFNPGTFGVPSNCSEPGDEVADTPVQNLPTGTCTQVDTCPQPGVDDVPNFMNYVDDHCYNHFTPQQAERMRSVTVAFRPSLF